MSANSVNEPDTGGLRFTAAARRLLADARTESDRLHHEYIGTEHLVLALTREPGDTATLARLGVDRDHLRELISQIIRPADASGARGSPHGVTSGAEPRPYTTRTHRAFHFAADSARTLGHTEVGVDHLVVGLLRERVGIAAQVLQEHGVTLERALGQAQRLGAA